MNDEPKSIWRKPWRGRGKSLAWFALLAGALFLMVVICGLVLEKNIAPSQLVLAAALISLLGVGFAVAAIAFVRWLCCWRNFRRFLFCLACFITLIALAYAGENWRGKRAWEKHMRQWEAKGEKFNMAALVPPPVPEAQNFALTPLLKPSLDFTRRNGSVVWNDTNGLARLDRLHPQQRPDRGTNDQLALGSLEKGTFADLEACREFYRGNTNYPQPSVPGTAAEDVLTALGKFDPELKELREAVVTRPSARYPIEYGYEPPWAILLPHLARLKGLCSLTHVRTLARLELGQSADAFEELKVGFRLSDSIRAEPFLIDHLVRIASLGINLQTVREGLVRHAWSDAQLAELEKYLASIDILAEYKLGMRGERALSTGGLDWLRRQGFRTDVMNYIGDENGSSAAFNPGFNPMPGGWFYQNMLSISRMLQDYTLAAVDEQTHRAFPDVVANGDRTLEKMRAGPYTIFAKILLPAVSKAARKSARMQTSVDAARVACALERSRLAEGKLPDTLDGLVPRFIEKIPTDVIDGKPLRYRPKPDGSYVVYSVGWNQTDESGEVAWTKGKEPSVDITKGDWVWQMPAK